VTGSKAATARHRRVVVLGMIQMVRPKSSRAPASHERALSAGRTGGIEKPSRRGVASMCESLDGARSNRPARNAAGSNGARAQDVGGDQPCRAGPQGMTPRACPSPTNSSSFTRSTMGRSSGATSAVPTTRSAPRHP
jgi:hypothetical protein